MTPLKVVSLLAMLAAPLLSGGQFAAPHAADDDRRVRFDNPYPAPFSSRNKPAALSREGDLILVDKGYAKIGTLEVQRVTERCLRKGKEEACTPVSHAADAAAEFAAEAAERGGDLAVLERIQEPGTEPYGKRGKCVAWEENLQYEYQIRYETTYDRSLNRVATRMVPSMKLVPRQQCARYETLEGRATTSTTAGSVWRLEPEYAEAQRRSQKFLYAAALGRTNEVEKLIAEGLDLNTRNMNGDLVLGFAALSGHREVVEALLLAGADVNATDLNGTALHRAAANGDLEIAKLLIEKKADVNAKMPYGRHKGATPLFDAARSGRAELVRYLVSSGATVDAPTEGGVTPLMIASLGGNTDVIDALVAAGASVAATSKPIPEYTRLTGWTGGWTPLMLSVVARKHASQMALIAHGAFITDEARGLGIKIGTAFDDAGIDRVFALGKRLASAKRSWGYIDATGKFVIPPRFRAAEPFSEGLAAVCEFSEGGKESCGFINGTGDFVIPPKYFSTASFSEGLGAATVLFSKKNPETDTFSACGYLDKTGKEAIPLKFAFCGKFSEGLAGVTVAGFKYGYIDKDGRWAISPKGKGSPLPFNGGYAQVWVQGMLKGQFKWIDRSGDHVSEDLEAVKKAAAQAAAGKSLGSAGPSDLRPTVSWTRGYPTSLVWGYSDAAGTVKIPGPFSMAHAFAGGLASVQVFAPESKPLVDQWAELWAEVTRDRDLMQAVRKGDTDAAARLLEQGADANARDEQGTTPLMLAAVTGRTGAAKLLLGKGADVRARDQRGYTALMFVAGSGNSELAELLLRSGSDREARNDLGLTVAEIAELLGDSKVGDLLQRAANR